jgi:hypothetical protein
VIISGKIKYKIKHIKNIDTKKTRRSEVMF